MVFKISASVSGFTLRGRPALRAGASAAGASTVAVVFSEYAVILLSADLVVAMLVLLTADPYNFINSFTATAIIKNSQKHSRKKSRGV